MELQSLVNGPHLLGGLLRTQKPNRPSCVYLCHRNPASLDASRRKMIKIRDQEITNEGQHSSVDYASLMRILRSKKMPHVAHHVFYEIKSEGGIPDYSTLSTLMLCYAENNFLSQAQAIWDELLNSSFNPKFQFISELINIYGEMGHFDEIYRVLGELSSRDVKLLPDIYWSAISCYGKNGQLHMMDKALTVLVSKGFSVNSSLFNDYVKYYSLFGSLSEMECAYQRLKRCRILIEEEGIRAMSNAYIKEKKFYRLSEFLRDVGLGRKNVGNLLWNLLLVSYAANFKMKSMQREFMNMVKSGFRPDITTFNIRAIAFSKMSLFWDLHVSLQHMEREKVAPDLVTCGCIVDAYLETRLGRNLFFALNKMNVDDSPPVIATDPFVFQVMGKGDFHSSSEAYLEFTNHKKWTYRKLVSTYLLKYYRSNQIFWNY